MPSCNKPLPKPMLTKFMLPNCLTRPQWVKHGWNIKKYLRWTCESPWFKYKGLFTMSLGTMNNAHFLWTITSFALNLLFNHWFLPEASFGLRVLSLLASVCVCVCLSVCLCVNHLLVRAITRDPLKLGLPNFDQRCKRPWLRSLLFCGAIDLDLQGQI